MKTNEQHPCRREGGESEGVMRHEIATDGRGFPMLIIAADDLDEWHRLEMLWNDIDYATDEPDCSPAPIPSQGLDAKFRTLTIGIHCITKRP